MLQHLLLVALLGAASAQIPRGVDPKNAAKYSGKQFTCLDGSKSIPSERVNDNYCDCPGDGSDEPGTAACYHGTFWCRNRGFEPSVISSSFVDDGVCDCCDGSDESAVGCSNTCLEKSAHERQAIRDKVAAYERSLEKKKQAEEHAKSLQSQWQQRSSSIQKELDEQQAEVKRIEEEKAKADAALEEERKAAEAEEARVAAEQAAAAAAAQAAGGDAAAEGSAAEGEQQQEQAAEVPHEETPEERGRRIASQWTHDPDAAGVPASHADEVAGEEHHEAGEFVPDDHEHIEHEADYQPLEHAPEDDHASYHHDTYTPPPPSAAQLAATDASNQLISARTRLEELKKEANLIDRYHVKRDQYDFGPGNVFLGLAGRCLIDRGQRWHYEACFFEKATQSEPYSSTNRVTLGYWKGFNADYTQALFTDGDICHGVGPRTFTIDFVCGEEEKVWGGEEPATCQYRATMSTPAACKLEDLAKEKAQLATLEAFEAEIRAEIEAAAKARAHTEL